MNELKRILVDKERKTLEAKQKFRDLEGILATVTQVIENIAKLLATKEDLFIS